MATESISSAEQQPTDNKTLQDAESKTSSVTEVPSNANVPSEAEKLPGAQSPCDRPEDKGSPAEPQYEPPPGSPPRPTSKQDTPQDSKPEHPKAPLPDIFFCFGQAAGEYLFKSPDDLLYNMPIELANILEETPIKRIFSASVGKKGAAWIHFEQEDGRKCQYRSSSLVKNYAKLEKWIKRAIDNDHGPLVVAFGEGDEYAAASTTKAKFVVERNQQLSRVLNQVDSCESITLGKHSRSYCVGIELRGGERTAWRSDPVPATKWNELVTEKGPGEVGFIALSPHNINQFFILFADGSAHYYVDDSFSDRLKTALEKAGIKPFPYELVNKPAAPALDRNRPATVAEVDEALRRFDKKNKKNRRSEAIGVGILIGVATGACSVM